MSHAPPWRNVALWTGIILTLLILPQLFRTGYEINILINLLLWITFALSFDLSAGHVGVVSLGHPVFFGLGAYTAALLAPSFGLGFVGATLLSALTMGVLAFVAGIAFFRISEVSFAIGTLGALIIAQLVTNNAYEITGGPMCVQNVSRPEFKLPGMSAPFVINTVQEYYYLLLPLLLLTVLIYHLLTTQRIGRAFSAVRQDEVRALAMGIFPLRYKLLAFVVGGTIIGALGSFQAHYITVVCPSELALTFTLNLLIIVFVGGSGHMWGVILGAVLFTVLPRILESSFDISPAYEQVAYGVILLLVIRFLPDGLYGLIDGLTKRLDGKTDAH